MWQLHRNLYNGTLQLYCILTIYECYQTECSSIFAPWWITPPLLFFWCRKGKDVRHSGKTLDHEKWDVIWTSLAIPWMRHHRSFIREALFFCIWLASSVIRKRIYLPESQAWEQLLLDFRPCWDWMKNLVIFSFVGWVRVEWYVIF